MNFPLSLCAPAHPLGVKVLECEYCCALVRQDRYVDHLFLAHPENWQDLDDTGQLKELVRVHGRGQL